MKLKEDSKEYAARYARLAWVPHMYPATIADVSIPGRRSVCKTIRIALTNMRIKANRGHWAYSVAEHYALQQLLRLEEAELRHAEFTEIEEAARHAA